jgi:hypothetical protein
MWEANRPPKTYGRMSEAEVKEIFEEAYGSGREGEPSVV